MFEGKKVLIFDLGGVLIDLHIDRSFAALVALGVEQSLLTEKGCLLNEYMQRYDRGDISTAEMFGYISSQLPLQVREEAGESIHLRIQEMWNAMLGKYDPGKFSTIEELRERGYRVVLLSNTNDGHWGEIERKFQATMGRPLSSYFDALYLSYRMHRRKPEPEIFRALLDAEGVEPAETLFFDDSAENCDAARALGMGAVLMERNASWGKELMSD